MTQQNKSPFKLYSFMDSDPLLIFQIFVFIYRYKGVFIDTFIYTNLIFLYYATVTCHRNCESVEKVVLTVGGMTV